MDGLCNGCTCPLDWPEGLAPFKMKDGKMLEYCRECWQRQNAKN